MPHTPPGDDAHRTAPGNDACHMAPGDDAHCMAPSKDSCCAGDKHAKSLKNQKQSKQSTCDNSNDPSKDTPLKIGYVFQTVVSEMLCFIQNKLGDVPVDVLVKLCSDCYDVKEIRNDKKILFKMVPPSK